MKHFRKMKLFMVIFTLTSIVSFEFSLFAIPTNAQAPAQQVFVIGGKLETVVASHTAFDWPRTLNQILDMAAKITVQTVTRLFLQQMTNWVRSGFRGEPQFLHDPERFFKNLARQGAVAHQLNLLATQLCYPLGRVGVPGLILQTPGVAGYPQLRCTLKNRNVQGFYDRFDNGGWQTWSEMLQPQNNVYGMSALAQDAGSIQIANRTTQGRDEIIASQGFIGVKNCALTAAFDSVVNGQNFSSQTCAQYRNLTPGSIIAKHFQESVSKKPYTDWVNISSFTELIVAAIDTALNRLVGTKFMCLSCANNRPGAGQTVKITSGTAQQCQASACQAFLCSGGTKDRTCFISQSACQNTSSGCTGGQCLNCVEGLPCTQSQPCPTGAYCGTGCTCILGSGVPACQTP